MQNFRGIKSGALEDLTPLVVLVGPNSSGKSTVLDALLLGGSSNFPVAVKRAAGRRRAAKPNSKRPDEGDYDSLFYKSSRFAEIAVATDGGARRIVMQNDGNSASFRFRTSITPLVEGWEGSPEEFFSNPKLHSGGDNPLPSVSAVGLVDSRDLSGMRTLEELYTSISQRGLRKEVKSFITAMVPTVDDLEILAPKNVPTLHLNFEDHALPIGLAGDGVQLLLRLVMALTAEPDTTLLLEEPESHMHPGAIRLIAQAIHGATARGVQVVLSTHSLELIDALTLGRPNIELARVAVYRIALDRGNLKSTRLDGQDVALARSSIEDDLR
jgi:ABC-type uncharacterized transport system ATPase component